MKVSKKSKAIWGAKVLVEKESNVPEVNTSAVMEEVPEVQISAGEEAALQAASVAAGPGTAEMGSRTGGTPAGDAG